MGLGALLALKGSFLLLHGSLDPLSQERGELRSHQNSDQRTHHTFVLPNLRSAVSEMRPMKLLAASSTRPPATTLWKKPAVWVNADALLNAGPALALMLLLTVQTN